MYTVQVHVHVGWHISAAPSHQPAGTPTTMARPFSLFSDHCFSHSTPYWLTASDQPWYNGSEHGCSFHVDCCVRLWRWLFADESWLYLIITNNAWSHAMCQLLCWLLRSASKTRLLSASERPDCRQLPNGQITVHGQAMFWPNCRVIACLVLMLDNQNAVTKPVAKMRMGLNVFPREKAKPKVPRNVLHNVVVQDILGQKGPLQNILGRNVHG